MHPSVHHLLSLSEVIDVHKTQKFLEQGESRKFSFKCLLFWFFYFLLPPPAGMSPQRIKNTHFQGWKSLRGSCSNGTSVNNGRKHVVLTLCHPLFLLFYKDHFIATAANLKKWALLLPFWGHQGTQQLNNFPRVIYAARKWWSLSVPSLSYQERLPPRRECSVRSKRGTWVP